jgi:hypothetical protein
MLVLCPLAALMIVAALSGRAAPAAPAPSVQFNRDVRPILSDNCFYCHGPDKTTGRPVCALDIREAALAKGAIVPGKPEKSSLIARVFAKNDALLMPPTSAHKTLSSAQKNLLKRWIAEGALYEPHWAYIAPQRPPVPTIRDTKRYPVRNPVDAFVFARLAKQGTGPVAGGR